MSATQEQGSGIAQVNQAVSQMDQVTLQNVALVEETAAAAEAMRQEADRLARLASVFGLQNGEVQKAAATGPAKWLSRTLALSQT